MKSLNVWYDAQPEPKRFLLFVSIIAIPIVVALSIDQLAGTLLCFALMIGRMWSWK